MARAAPIDLFPPGSAARELVRRMIAARLLVADRAGDTTKVRPAHDALLTHWQRARDLLAEHRRDLETRSLVEAQLQRWKEERARPRALLLRDPDLADAVDLLRRRGDELDPETRRYITASMRIARRRQTLMAAAVALFAMMSLAAVWQWNVADKARLIAQQQQDAATANFQAALDATVTLMEQVQDNLRNGRISVAVASELLTSAEGTLADLDQTGSTAKLMTSQVRLLLTLADTLTQLGRPAESLARLENARRLAERLAIEPRDGGGGRYLLATVLGKIGDVQTLQGDLQKAALQYREATQVAEDAARADPGDARLQALLASLHNRLGDAMTLQGRLDEALAEYRRSLAISERLAASDPSSLETQRTLADALTRTGDVQLASGDYAGALQSYRQALAIQHRLAERHPNDTQQQARVAASLGRIGRVQFEQRDLSAALQSVEQAEAITRRLAALDPSNAAWARDLAVALERGGDILLALGRTSDALQSYRERLAIIERLAKIDPQNSVWQRDLALAHWDLGDALAKQNDNPEALASYREALAILERMASADPDNRLWQEQLAQLRDVIAKLSP